MSSELYKAHEEVTTRNIVAIRDYSTETRRIVKDNRDEIGILRNQVQDLKGVIEILNSRITQLQIRLYQNGN